MATYPTAAPGTTLTAIQTKVRRLTRTPSEAQLSTDELNNYINTAVIYDFPAQLRTFQLRRPFTFFCNPYLVRHCPCYCSHGTTLFSYEPWHEKYRE